MIMELPDTAVMMASECSLECVCNKEVLVPIGLHC